MPEVNVERNDVAHRFEVKLNGRIAKLNYSRSGDTINYIHTEVPPEFRGQGIGGKLAKAALDYAQNEGLKVTPSCPFLASYVRRHPEYLQVLTPEYRKKLGS